MGYDDTSREFINHKMISRFDRATGDLIVQDDFVETRKVKKMRGFRLAYLENVMDLCPYMPTPNACYIVIDIFTRLPSRYNYEVELNAEKLSKYYNTGLSTIRRIITKLKKLKLIVCIDKSTSRYLLSPYFVIPKFMSDDLVAYFQDEWDKRMGIKRELHITPEEAAGRSMNSPV